MRLPGNTQQPDAGNAPLHYQMAYPAGATLAGLETFIAAARRAGAGDDTRLIVAANRELIVLLAVPVPDDGTTADLAEVNPVPEQLDPGSAVNPGGGMRRGL